MSEEIAVALVQLLISVCVVVVLSYVVAYWEK